MNLRLHWQAEPAIDRLLLTKAQRGNEKMDVFWLPDPRPIALSPDCRLVSTIHDLSPLRYPQFFSLKTRLWHLFLNIPNSIKRSARIITVSETIKQELVQTTGTPASKITATPLGVRDNLRRPSAAVLRNVRQKYQLPAHFVLSLSVLEPRKNLPRLIRAFAQLKKETDLPHQLVLAGSADPSIFADTKLAIHDWLHFVGFIPETDKAAMLSAADAFAFPSLYEGFGLPVLEALACGTPVLASDIPALREIAGSAAIFVDPENINAWSISMRKLLSEPKRAARLARSGPTHTAKQTWRETARKTLHVLQNSP